MIVFRYIREGLDFGSIPFFMWFQHVNVDFEVYEDTKLGIGTNHVFQTFGEKNPGFIPRYRMGILIL